MPRFRERHGDASRRRAADAVRLNPRCRRDRVATWRLWASLPRLFFCTCFPASLTCNTHARARMHARHCTSDMKQIRFTPAEGRTPEREAKGGGGWGCSFLCKHARSRRRWRRVRARVIPERRTRPPVSSRFHSAGLNYKTEDSGRRLRCS